jgi:hypothetical protein
MRIAGIAGIAENDGPHEQMSAISAIPGDLGDALRNFSHPSTVLVIEIGNTRC